jgi:hypothetical protein
VPCLQPLAALAIFERPINDKDIAAGELTLLDGYLTAGPKDSTYREDNLTVQFYVSPPNATYNHAANAPNEVYGRMELVQRRGTGLMSSTKKFKP